MRLLALCFVLFLGLSSNAQEKSEDFTQFCEKFFSDPTFQLSRIRFPLPMVEPRKDTDSFDTVTVGRGEWQYSDFGYGKKQSGSIDRYEARTYDNFALRRVKRLRNTKKRVVGFEGIDNGIRVYLYFHLQKNRWMLVRFEDRSD